MEVVIVEANYNEAIIEKGAAVEVEETIIISAEKKVVIAEEETPLIMPVVEEPVLGIETVIENITTYDQNNDQGKGNDKDKVKKDN